VADGPGLRDLRETAQCEGEVTLSDLIIWARAVHYASLAQLVGIFAFLVFIGEPAIARGQGASLATIAGFRAALRPLAWASLGVAVGSGSVWLVLQAAAMSGQPVAQVVCTGVVRTVLTSTQFGRDWDIRGTLVLIIACALPMMHESDGLRAATIRVGLLLLTTGTLGGLAWAGHAGAAVGISGDVHLGADVVHLIAAGIWLGGLLPLAWRFASARRFSDPAWAKIAAAATVRFSMMGLITVSTLLITGAANTWFLAGSVPALVGTDYGRLLLLKVVLFLAMVSLAARNRLRLMPCVSSVDRLASSALCPRDALAQLQRNALTEATIGLAILIIVGTLGTMPPPLHSHAM
jgi:copper resistance protein D